MSKILVAGEALIDFLPIRKDGWPAFLARPGGSPYNTAIGLGRLEVPTAYLGAISKDVFGELLFHHLEENGVDTEHVLRVDRPTALSFVLHSEEAEPRYLFYGQSTADMQLYSLPAVLPEEVKAIHLGSLAMLREPCGLALTRLMEREHPRRVLSFDPNVRPNQLPDLRGYRKRFSSWLSKVDILKLSRADLSHIAPGEREEEVVERWLSLGPKVIVVTLGQRGARGYTDAATVEVEAPPVQVVDTVGAGDAFTAGLLAALDRFGKLDRGDLAKLKEEELRRALGYAVRAAAITCTRVGADPPRFSELGAP